MNPKIQADNSSFVVSRKKRDFPFDAIALEGYWFSNWQSEQWPYRWVESGQISAGDEIFWCVSDQKPKVILWRTVIKKVVAFSYTSTEEMLEWAPSGLFYSNGPGDPAASPEVVAEVAKGIGSGLPVFGICLGHQMIALASGLSTFKMHNGHRGINHPVKNIETGKGEITSQNHGFVVNMEDVEKAENVALTHIHLNDQTVAGIKRTDANCFSVQFHPEASPGPHDSRYLFDDFIERIKNH